MQKTESKEFTDDQGTLRVQSMQLSALRAFRLMGRLGKLLGPALTQLKGVKFRGTNSAALLPALAALFESMDPEEAETLAVQVLEGTMVVHGDKFVTLNTVETINAVFGGRLMTMLKVMVFAAEVNFRDFFTTLTQPAEAGDAAPVAAADPAPPASPSRSTFRPK